MGQVLHGSATTTEAVRRAIQRSEESVRALALRHGISPISVGNTGRAKSLRTVRLLRGVECLVRRRARRIGEHFRMSGHRLPAS